MEEVFELPVSYNKKQLLFPVKLIQFGYTYRIEVDVEGTIISFERDEEGNWRALMNTETRNPKVNIDLLNAIAHSLDTI